MASIIKTLFALMASASFAWIHTATLHEKYPINFFDAMAHSKQFKSSYRTHTQWQLLKNLYDRAMNNPYNLADKPRIPLVFHLIWLGSMPPASYLVLKKKLEELHPDCIVRLWTDAEAKTFPMLNRRAFNAALNYGEKSDIFRYEILYAEGGVYLDGDFEILLPFTDLFYACNIFAGMAYSTQIELYNGLIGASPQHPIIKQCIDTLSSGGPKHDFDAIINRTGPLHFTRCFMKLAPQVAGITLPLPVAFFYPWPQYARKQTNKAAIKQYIKPYSFAVHHWACSWIKS